MAPHAFKHRKWPQVYEQGLSVLQNHGCGPTANVCPEKGLTFAPDGKYLGNGRAWFAAVFLFAVFFDRRGPFQPSPQYTIFLFRARGVIA
jgi:hypothetical protein